MLYGIGQQCFMELQSLIKYSYAFHYLVDTKGVNNPLHSFAKPINNAMRLVF